MKKLFTNIICLSSCFALFGSDLCSPEACCQKGNSKNERVINEDLKAVLAPNAQFLNSTTIYSDKPIYAYQTSCIWGKTHCSHRGQYIDGMITTTFGKTMLSEPEIGNQRIDFMDVNRPFSCSNSWNIETIAGIRYAVHYHDGFKVYTSSDKQFVLTD